MKKITILIALFAIGALFMAGCANPTGGRSGDKSSVKADAGADKIVNLFTADNKMKEITLDGSLSKGAATYKWAQTEDSKHAVILDNESVFAKFIPRSEGIYKFILQVTDKNGGQDSDEVIVEVQLNPDIYLRSPVINEAVISSNERLLDISGMCDKGIVSVSAANHTNNKNFDGRFDSEYYFTVAGIELLEGDNDVEIIGLDKSGEFSKRKLLVTYNKDIKFLSSPVFSKNSGYDNETSIISISVHIDYNAEEEGLKVSLLEIDNNFRIINDNIAVLYDNGNSSNCDKKALDGVFSGKATLVNPAKGVHKYRVAVTKSEKVYYSSPVEFTSLTDIIGTEEYDLATEAVNKAADRYHRTISNKLTEEDILEKRQLTVHELLTSPYIKSAVLSSDNATIWITFNSGMETFIMFELIKKNNHPANSEIKQKPENSHDFKYDKKLTPNSKPQTNNNIEMFQPRVIKEPKQIGSYRTRSLSPFEYDFGKTDDVYGAYREILESKTPKFNAENPKMNLDVTVADLIDLSRFGIILISTHGGYEEKTNTTLIPLMEEATKNKVELYKEYINEKSIIHGRTYVREYEEIDGKITLKRGNTVSRDIFAISPTFITKYSGKMPNSIVSLGSCDSFKALKLEKAFKNNGAGLVIGYDNSVDIWYSHNICLNFFRAMIRGTNAGDAKKNVKNLLGENDKGNPPAYFVTDGDDTLVLETSGIKNGGFEDSDNFWESNGMTINVNDNLPNAVEGKNKAVTSIDNAFISQRFKVPTNVRYLSFYNFNYAQANVTGGSANWGCDGKFRASLVDEQGNSIIIGGYDFINIANEIFVYGDDKDTWYRTDWKKIEYPIASFAGQYVTLKFTLVYVLENKGAICRNEIQLDKIALY